MSGNEGLGSQGDLDAVHKMEEEVGGGATQVPNGSVVRALPWDVGESDLNAPSGTRI